MKNIDRASEYGHTQVTYFGNLSPEVLEEFESYGYEITTTRDPRGFFNTNSIEW